MTMSNGIPKEKAPKDRKQAIPPHEGNPSGQATPFSSNDQVLESALLFFRVREELADRMPLLSAASDAAPLRALQNRERRSTALWHQRLKLTPRSIHLAELTTKHRLNRIESEILIALLLDSLGLWSRRVKNTGDILNTLFLPPTKALMALRCLSETGKLHRTGLVYSDDPDEDLRERSVTVDPALVEMALNDKSASVFQAKTENEFHEELARMTRILQKKADHLDNLLRGYGSRADFEKWSRKSNRLLREVDQVLDAHPTWFLAKTRTAISLSGDWAIVLVLMGKALGHLNPEDALFKGAGLARAASRTPDTFKADIKRLMSGAPLLQDGYIQPCGGMDSLLSESSEAIQETEFELTDKTLQGLGLEKLQKLAAQRDSTFREPRVRLADMVLPGNALNAIKLALDHVRGADTLMNQWGLRDSFPYGRGATMLFYGPPGTGKTATAEAIAHELSKPLLVADYSQIQNCYVGQTEKNIVSTFRKARQFGAVLFWDEADAMFFDRDAASRAWEVRDVNVILQEIERFEGVCILATNRKATLDKALERRITAKVEFPRPVQHLRESIWRKLTPLKLPLSADVDFAVLSATDLSGGEIKNAVLNAARMGYGRSSQGPVTLADFRKAIQMETEHRWAQLDRRAAGFSVRNEKEG